MNREDYQKVKKIFQSVLDLSLDEREEYLNDECSENPALRSEVERLLGSFNSDYLEQPAIGKVAKAIVSKSNLSIGQKIGHYKIIKKLGAGGMGEVFLAEDMQLKRKIALKILPAAVSQNKNYLRRFKQEAYSASALNHPNILTVHEFSDENGMNFIATEFVEGKTLRERFAEGERLSLSETLEIVLQVVAALAAAHEAEIVHRDIKPENIMIRNDGLVKVLDFGLAKLMRNEKWENNEKNSTSPSLLSTPGMIMGTASYMSPEQARGKKNDARSDIFSFGIVFYEMLTGKRAFEGENSVESISSILKDEPQPISQLLPEVPEEIERIVNKTLRKDRSERYQTAKDLLTDLKSAKHNLELHKNLDRAAVTNREAIQTQILPATLTNENQNQLTLSAKYFVAQVKQPRFIYPTLAVLAVALIGSGIYRYIQSLNSQSITFSSESVKIMKVTYSGKVGEPVALSRDGKWLVYSIVEGEKQSLWLKQVEIPDSNTQIVPPATVNYRTLTLSPDGNYLYYSIEEGRVSNCTVFQMPLLGGGTARKLISGINGGISFSPDGKQITYGVEDLENDESILMIANADGTEPRQLVKLKGNDEIASSRGRWSPDGKSIVLWVGTNNPRTQDLATVSVATGEITRLETPKFEEFLLWDWLSDGKGIIVLARDKPDHKPEFWQISFTSGKADKITNDLNSYGSLSLTADANILATVQGSWLTNISIVSVSDTATATPVTSGSYADFNPKWTPDGKLVYERITGDIFIVDPRGGNPKRLSTTSNNRFTTVSPDGRYVVYVSSQTGTPSIWRMDIDGSNPHQLTTEFSVEPSISLDGREVIYTVGVDTARIWKVGIDGGQPVQLTDQESRNAVFSPDGKQFACRWWETPNSQPKIAIISATGGKPVRIFDLNAAGFRWMPDGRSFIYSVSKDGVSNIWSQPIDGGKPKQITNFTTSILHSFDFSPDGKQIAIARGTGTSDAVLISGFRK